MGTDVFIIGGGPVGLAAAIAMRKKGFSVTLADGAQPPIEKACGEGLLPDTLAALAGLGVTIDAREGYPLRGIRFLGDRHEVAAKFPGQQGLGLRRATLHRRLVEQAEACGVSLRWKAPVTAIGEVGVRVAGELVAARWIIGADGLGSRVRKWSGLEAGKRLSIRYAFRRHYRIEPWSEFLEVYWGASGQAYVTPVGQEEVCVVRISRQAETRCDDLEVEFPQLGKRLRGATLVGEERGGVTIMQKLRQVYRSRVALIGDASGSVDAITGEGLGLGFRQVIALADALEPGALDQYAVAHRKLVHQPAMMAQLMLALDAWPALRERVIRALASDARLFARLLAVHVGAISTSRLATAGAQLAWRLIAA
jgi:2-polyprenyl-6-methoxyphenol hydroxylase-like FAD-dependent oxidoreductase